MSNVWNASAFFSWAIWDWTCSSHPFYSRLLWLSATLSRRYHFPHRWLEGMQNRTVTICVARCTTHGVNNILVEVSWISSLRFFCFYCSLRRAVYTIEQLLTVISVAIVMHRSMNLPWMEIFLIGLLSSNFRRRVWHWWADSQALLYQGLTCKATVVALFPFHPTFVVMSSSKNLV